MEWEIPGERPLLDERGTDQGMMRYVIIPIIMFSSATGTLTLKFAQQNGSATALTIGYLLEGFAFAVYPYSLRYHTLRVVSAAWASSSIITSYVGGALIYQELPSVSSMCGGALIVVGVALASWS